MKFWIFGGLLGMTVAIILVIAKSSHTGSSDHDIRILTAILPTNRPFIIQSKRNSLGEKVLEAFPEKTESQNPWKIVVSFRKGRWSLRESDSILPKNNMANKAAATKLAESILELRRRGLLETPVLVQVNAESIAFFRLPLMPGGFVETIVHSNGQIDVIPGD